MSEYGIADDESGETHACATEEEVYERLGMQYIAPELRENRGELAAARAGELPELIELEDIRGDLHMHTVASDGRNTIEEMAEAARERGYVYAAITDHSASHGFGDHVTPDELLRQIERVRSVEAEGLHAARRHRGERAARRLARLRRRAARAARLGRGQRAHVVPDGRARDDRPDGRARSSTRSSTRSAIPPGG